MIQKNKFFCENVKHYYFLVNKTSYVSYILKVTKKISIQDFGHEDMEQLKNNLVHLLIQLLIINYFKHLIN